MIPRTRKEAKESGARKYFTGNPCPRGHIAERYTSKGSCVECLLESVRSQKRKQYFNERYNENKDDILKRNREKYASCAETRRRRKENYEKWARENPEKVSKIKKSYKHKRRAREACGCSTSEMIKFEEESEKACFWCGIDCSEFHHLDHFVPLSRGGVHETRNFVISCPSCNIRKSSYHPRKFAKMIGYDTNKKEFVDMVNKNKEYGEVGRISITPEMLK